ncbi:hypothetical protein Ancab_000404 [Ancistrocladus abbreviatus]
MASLQYFLLIAFVVVCILVSPTSPNELSNEGRIISVRPHHNHNKNERGFHFMLDHVDSDKNLTKFERIRRAIMRGKNRLQMLKARRRGSLSVLAPVYAGNGEFLMKLAIGTPRRYFSAIMDTGSDLIWIQCLPCELCFNQSTPIFDPKKSSSFSKLSCSSKLCLSLPEPICSNHYGCIYVYEYGDSSSTQGYMGSETFTFGLPKKSISLHEIGFGCGLNNQGGFSDGAGIVGLGRGPLSLVSQLAVSKFSYCLTSITSSKTSTLLMGSLANKLPNARNKTTRLVKNPTQPSFYYITLEGISVSTVRLPIQPNTFALNKDGMGGTIVDSGTTITYLKTNAYYVLKDELIRQINLTIVDEYYYTGLDLCFKLPRSGSRVKFPKLVFHFEGANLALPTKNYMVEVLPGVVCLAMGSSDDLSIFGNIQQQNMLLLYELHQEKLTFMPAKCDGM